MNKNDAREVFVMTLGNLFQQSGITAGQALNVNPDYWFDALVEPLVGYISPPRQLETLWRKFKDDPDDCCDSYVPVMAEPYDDLPVLMD